MESNEFFLFIRVICAQTVISSIEFKRIRGIFKTRRKKKWTCFQYVQRLSPSWFNKLSINANSVASYFATPGPTNRSTLTRDHYRKFKVKKKKIQTKF